MGKWQECGECDGAVCWMDGGVQVTLKQGQLVDPRLKEQHEIEIADAIIYEWQELLVTVTPVERPIGKTFSVQSIQFGEQPADQIDDGLWRFTFRNYLGKSVIRIKFADGRVVTTDPIEVVSSKTPLDENHDLFYPKFLRALIDDLIRYLVSLPFDWGAPTEFPTEERVQP
ncbi:MAG: hypothetical protein KEFWMYNX_002229, partial [Candidatus Fervidibacter sp.]